MGVLAGHGAVSPLGATATKAHSAPRVPGLSLPQKADPIPPGSGNDHLYMGKAPEIRDTLRDRSVPLGADAQTVEQLLNEAERLMAAIGEIKAGQAAAGCPCDGTHPVSSVDESAATQSAHKRRTGVYGPQAFSSPVAQHLDLSLGERSYRLLVRPGAPVFNIYV